MFECALANGDLFKKIVQALSDLVEQGNFMVDPNMISFQGMDSSHVSLVALQLKECGFQPYRCDRDLVLGLQFASLNKILKCMTSKDSLSIRADDDGDVVQFIFESNDDKRFSQFELKLNDIDQEQLGIPETHYSTDIRMPSTEFQRICRDLSAIGDTVTISATKNGVKFSVNGDIGSGDMTLKGLISSRKKKKNKNNNDENKNNNDEDEDDDMMGKKVKDEPKDGNNDETQMDEDNDEDMENNNNNNNDDDDEDEDIPTGNIDDDDDDNQIIIRLDESVTQTFSLRYLNNFTKATGLSKNVTLRMGADVPLECEYKIEDFGSIRYYLAPKIDDDE